MRRQLRRFFPIPVLVMLFACKGMVGGSPRPATDGYRATLIRRFGKSSPPIEARVAWRAGSERREEGAKTVLLRADPPRIHEKDGAGPWTSRPPLAGEGVEMLEGAYPLRPIRFSDDELARLRTAWPEATALVHTLSDATVGVHPCDAVRIDRTLSDGAGISETRYYARDLDGLVVRRELVRIRDRQYAERIGSQELRDVRAGVPADLFEPK